MKNAEYILEGPRMLIKFDSIGDLFRYATENGFSVNFVTSEPIGNRQSSTYHATPMHPLVAILSAEQWQKIVDLMDAAETIHSLAEGLNLESEWIAELSGLENALATVRELAHQVSPAAVKL